MAHAAQLAFVELVTKSLSPKGRVLEIGSLDISGSVRQFFPGCEYTGIDVAPGPGVDVVCEGQKFDAPAGSFDVVISCEAMEHNPYWAVTFNNMVRLSSDVVIMTCATTGRPEHGTPRSGPQASPLTLHWNYYRNLTAKDFAKATDVSKFGFYRFWTNWSHFDLYFLGFKADTTSARETAQRVDSWIARLNGSRVHKYRSTLAKSLGDRWFRAMNSAISAMAWLHRPR